MAAKQKYVKLTLAEVGGQNLAGYKVVGDFIEDGDRKLLLEMPAATVTAKKRGRTPKVNAPEATNSL